MEVKFKLEFNYSLLIVNTSMLKLFSTDRGTLNMSFENVGNLQLFSISFFKMAYNDFGPRFLEIKHKKTPPKLQFRVLLYLSVTFLLNTSFRILAFNFDIIAKI